MSSDSDPTHATRREGAVARVARDESLVGARVGHFVLRRKLGEGGMGVVYEALDERLGRIVALKMLLTRTQSADAKRRFVREARAASRVHHPNVATVFEAGEDELGAYIAMELVPGKTMRHWLRASPPFAERLRVAREIASALAAAHASGIVHRDLKPDNVMVGEDGAAKVLDFGLAKQSESDAIATDDTRTAEGVIMGTPSYMSPEQVRGAALDARSDVFSFGVLLHETFTGQRPFRGETPGAILMALAKDEPRSLRELAPEVPRELDTLVLRCLEKSPEARYAHGGEVAQALAAVPQRATVSRRTPLLIAAGIIAAASVAAAARTFAGAHRGESTTNASASDASVAAAAPTVDASTEAAATSSAFEAMRRGFTAQRDLAPRPCDSFEDALRIDSAFVPARLRLALCRLVAEGDGASARAAFAEAARAHDKLGERDRALLDAWEPALGRARAATGETLARMKPLALRYDDDVEIAIFTAIAQERVDANAAIALFSRVTTLDPGSAFAHAAIARLEADTGRFEEARRASDRCLELAPRATACLETRVLVVEARGACAEVEPLARQLLASGDVVAGASALGDVFASTGRPLDEVRALLEGGSAVDGDARELALARLDIVQGAYDAAIARLERLDSPSDPLPAARRLLDPLLRELGRVGATSPAKTSESRDAGDVERAAGACDAFRSPLEHAQAAFALGQMREAAGDREGACAAYDRVVARAPSAGTATQRKARARVAALGCAR